MQDPSHTTIVVRRAFGSASLGARLSVVIDGVVVERLRPRRHVAVPTTAGSHEVKVTLHHYTSPTVTVNLAAGEIVRLECKSSVMAMTRARFGIDEIFSLREIGRGL